MVNLLFNPDSPPSKKTRYGIYEHSIHSLVIISRKRKGMVFTTQNLQDIAANTAKVSADGTINTHYDIDITEPAIGEILVFDGAAWRNQSHPVADGSINTHNDVDYGLAVTGEVLTWDGNKWTNLPSGESGTGITPAQASAIVANTAKVSADGSINTHSDVQVSPLSGDLLAYDGTNWINIPAITGITPGQASAIIANTAKVSADGSINTHSDVQVSPLPGDLLAYDGTNWINIPAITGITVQQSTDITTNNAKVGITPAQASAITANTAKVSADGSINTHNDVQVSPLPGDLLTYNGTNWVNRNPPKTYQTISTTKYYHITTYPIGIVDFAINDLATPFYTTIANQTIFISVAIGYEKSEPGVFVLFVGGNEVGSPANANRVNGIAPYLIASNIRHTCFTYVMTIATPGYYVGEVKLRYDNVVNNSPINFAFNRPKVDTNSSPNSSSIFSIIVL
jgi:hypothetical protein